MLYSKSAMEAQACSLRDLDDGQINNTSKDNFPMPDQANRCEKCVFKELCISDDQQYQTSINIPLFIKNR